MKMRDTEGAPLKEDWDLAIWGDGEVSLSVHMEVCPFGDEYYESNGAHVLTVNINDVMDEYISQFIILDETEDSIKLANTLRSLSDKLLDAVKKGAN